MTMKVKDLPDMEADTLATRLRTARDAKGLTRSEVQTQTGIPARTIEKFEFGSQEPSVSRLVELSKIYEVSIQELIGPEAYGANDDTAPAHLDFEDGDMPEDEDLEDPDIEQIEGIETASAGLDLVRETLERLDSLREDNFRGQYRLGLALIEDFKNRVRFLEPGEVNALAHERDLFSGSLVEELDLLELFEKEPREANDYCCGVEERILDTAVLGIDLLWLRERTLQDLHDRLQGRTSTLFEFLDSSKLVVSVRGPLREGALSGNQLDLGNIDEFPRRDAE